MKSTGLYGVYRPVLFIYCFPAKVSPLLCVRFLMFFLVLIIQHLTELGFI